MLYVLLFFAALLVDLLPFFGPPAWTVMMFFQLCYHLNIWCVLIVGVLGSALSRYLLALYMPYLDNKVLNKQKDEDLKFFGEKMNSNFWKTQTFVIFYTLLPLPSTPLFTVVGLSKINPLRIIMAFLTGKFLSDALMVHAVKFAAENVRNLHALTWKSISGIMVGLLILLVILFID
ncbi:MAG: hypothetical protein C4330_12305 [Chitinophagaceae bacterium]